MRCKTCGERKPWRTILFGIESPSWGMRHAFCGRMDLIADAILNPRPISAESWALIERMALGSGAYDDHDDCQICRERGEG